MGQSCTLSGRCTTRHMGSFINKKITGKYELGKAVAYGDSVTGDSIIRTDVGHLTIEHLFETSGAITYKNGKEYVHPEFKVYGYRDGRLVENTSVSFLVRHRTTKKKWRLKTSNGKEVVVTNDHSIMIERDGELVEEKPENIVKGDPVFTISEDVKLTRAYVEEIECLGNFENEYVYDLSIEGEKSVFFANDILVKNTDSIFFTIPEENTIGVDVNTLTKDQHIEIADTLAKEVNQSFRDFFMKTFNVPEKNTPIIKCGREICSTSTLFIKKKRYASLYFIDDKNVRHDKNGKNGKLKIMGLDIKRADCPEWVQDKLEETLYQLLDKNLSDDDMIEFVRNWRKEFVTFTPWKMGLPKRCNKVTYYSDCYAKGKKVTIPGHVGLLS